MEAGSVLVRIMADSTALTAGLNRASGQMAAFGAKMSKVGMGMTKYLTLPLVAVGAVSLHMAADFESSMKLIQTQAGGSAKDVEVLSKAILGMKDVQHGPKELADSLYHLKSVGMDNVQAMEALKLAEQGASVGGAKLEETTNAIAGAWRTGIKGAQSFKQAMGTLNAIVGAGNLRMEDLNQALGTGILVSAKTFGVSLTSVGAALALFTSQGMPATQSATRLRMAISMMGAPTAQAAKLLQGVGIGATDLARALRSGGIVEAVGLLKQHMEGLSKIQQSTLLSGAFGGARTGTAIMALVDGYDTLIEKQKQIEKNASGFLGAVGAQAEDAAAKWHTFVAEISKAAIKLGNVLLPIASSMAEDLGKVATAFSNLSPGVQSFIVKVGLAAAIAGPFVFGIAKMVGVLATLRTAMLGAAAAQALMAATGAGGGLAAVGASATTAAAGVRTFYVAASGAASTTGALAASGVSAGLAMGALGLAAAGAVATMIALGGAAMKVHDAMVKIQSDSSVAGTVAADLAVMVKGIGQAMGDTVSKMASGAMSMGKGQKYLQGFIDTLQKVRVEAVKVGDQKMISQIDGLIGRYKGLQGQVVKLGGVKFRLGSPKDQELVNATITKVKANIDGLKDRITVLGKMKPTPAVKAEISDLKAKLATSEAALKKLNGMKTEPKVTANVKSALASIFAVVNALTGVHDKTVTITTINRMIEQKSRGHHSGGIATGPESGYQETLHGRELILPLSHPNLIPDLLARAGIAMPGAGGGRGGGRGSGGGGSDAAAVNAGKRMALGIAKGIKAGQAKAVAAAAELAGNIASVLDSVLGIGDSLTSLGDRGLPTVKVAREWAKKVATLVRAMVAAMKSELGKIKLGKKDATVNRFGAASSLAGSIASIFSAFTELTPESIDKAMAGIAYAKTQARAIAAAVASMVKDFRAELKLAISEGEATTADRATGVAGNVADILSMFAEMTIAGIGKAIVGMNEAARKAPELAVAMKSMVQALQAELVGVTASAEFVALVESIASVVGNISSILGSLVDMTEKAIQDAIWGAGWVALKAQDLGKALKLMIGWLAYALQGIDATSLTALQDSLNVLADIASAISSIVNDLSEMTGEKLTAAAAAGASLGEGFYTGLLSWHQRIIDEAAAIARDTALALAGNGSYAATPAFAVGAGASNTTIVNHNTYSVSVPIGNVQATSPAQARGLADHVANVAITKLATATRTTRRGSVGG